MRTHPERLVLDEERTGLERGARERLGTALADLAADPAGPAVVLVTHHVEEIPPGFDHLALMSGGRIVASGRLDAVLSSSSLSACYEENLGVERREHRYRAWLAG